MIPDDLVAGVELLCLDAGNTVIFLDHERLAELIREATGVPVDPGVLVREEGEAKRRAESGDLHDGAWTHRARPGALGWGRMVGTIALLAGIPADGIARLLDHAWDAHVVRNLWCKVPEGLGRALDAARATGVKTAIISNSEGMLEKLFTDLGIRSHLDLVVDSGLVGVEKPDPRIYGFALDHFGFPASKALHLGDIFATDILGARAAGMRSALIDPYGHYEGRHLDVPRVPGVVAVADALAHR